jgi:autonomous glycyl radical cofactor GrcA
MITECGDAVLAGSLEGRDFLSRMIQRTGREPGEPEAVLLDFSAIEIATSSFLREAVVRLRDMLRGRRSNFYPIIANANDAVTEELTMLLHDHGDALLSCTTNSKGQPVNVEPIGRMEGIQQRTFELIRERGEIGAVEARDLFPEETATVTAWNNRFAALAERGLVIELSRGRLKRYRAVLKED